MDKRVLVRQLADSLRESARVSRTAHLESLAEVNRSTEVGEKNEGARVVMEHRSMAHAQSRRAKEALRALSLLDGYSPPELEETDRIRVGALVEVEDEDTGEGRTFLLLPVGAGATLTGPGGDGHLSVVTPASPIGKAVLGHRVGDTIDVTVKREAREWTITFVG